MDKEERVEIVGVHNRDRDAICYAETNTKDIRPIEKYRNTFFKNYNFYSITIKNYNEMKNTFRKLVNQAGIDYCESMFDGLLIPVKWLEEEEKGKVEGTFPSTHPTNRR